MGTHADSVRDRFDARGAEYLSSSVHVDGPDLDYAEQLVAQALPAGAWALDVGCGAGHLSFRLAPRVRRQWPVRIEFAAWIRRMSTPPEYVTAIRSLQHTAPAEVQRALRIEQDGSFVLQTGLFWGRRWPPSHGFAHPGRRGAGLICFNHLTAVFGE
jgi:hypothetical protein